VCKPARKIENVQASPRSSFIWCGTGTAAQIKICGAPTLRGEWFLVLLLFFGQGMVLSAMLQLPRMNRESFWWLHLRCILVVGAERGAESRDQCHAPFSKAPVVFEVFDSDNKQSTLANGNTSWEFRTAILLSLCSNSARLLHRIAEVWHKYSS